MISIIVTLILTGIAWYNGIDYPRLFCLFLMGLCASFVVNWFFRAAKLKQEDKLKKCMTAEYRPVKDLPIRAMLKGEPKYSYYAAEEISGDQREIVVNCCLSDGIFREKDIPAELVSVVSDQEPFIRINRATKWIWGDIWQSIIPYKMSTDKYELHIPSDKKSE